MAKEGAEEMERKEDLIIAHKVDDGSSEINWLGWVKAGIMSSSLQNTDTWEVDCLAKHSQL